MFIYKVRLIIYVNEMINKHYLLCNHYTMVLNVFKYYFSINIKTSIFIMYT